MSMGYIKIAASWFPLGEYAFAASVDGKSIYPAVNGEAMEPLGGNEAAALIAWLNVPNHMAGVIDPLDRDVMAWWERRQTAGKAFSNFEGRYPIDAYLRDRTGDWEGNWQIVGHYIDEEDGEFYVSVFSQDGESYGDIPLSELDDFDIAVPVPADATETKA